MAKNKGKSENLEVSMARIDFLIQEGFSKKEIAKMAGIKYGTFLKISNGNNKDITDDNYQRIRMVHSEYIRNQTNDFYDDEPVIDSEDELEGVQEIKRWIIISATAGIICAAILWFAIAYIISLF